MKINAVKKPIWIEAVQWDGTNKEEIMKFVGDKAIFYDFKNADEDIYAVLNILTMEGRMSAKIGDYIIKGVKGEFYPCDKDIFVETYDFEVVDDEEATVR